MTTRLPTTGAFTITASVSDTDRLTRALREDFDVRTPPLGADLSGVDAGTLVVCDVERHADLAIQMAQRCRAAGVGLLVCCRTADDLPPELAANLASRW